MTYSGLKEIMELLKGDLENYLDMLETDKLIIENRDKFKTVCKPDEIAEGYVEELQELISNLQTAIYVAQM